MLYSVKTFDFLNGGPRRMEPNDTVARGLDDNNIVVVTTVSMQNSIEVIIMFFEFRDRKRWLEVEIRTEEVRLSPRDELPIKID